MDNNAFIISEEEIANNKEEYLKLIKSIKRPNSQIDKLINWLESSDFFVAPASVKYHHNYKGGLCKHSLQVYRNLCKLIEEDNPRLYLDPNTDDALKILALCHDFQKVNFYKEIYRNEKQYCANGSKKDDGGRFDWVAVKSYSWKEPEECFMYGNHETTSEYMIRQFFNLTLEESVAILHHHAGMSEDCAKDNIGHCFTYNPYVLWLHTADMKSAYYDR